MRSAKFITTFDYDRSSWGLIERSDYNTEDMVNLQRFLCVAELVMLDMYRGDVMMEMESSPTVSCYEPICSEDYVWNITKEEIVNVPVDSGAFLAFGVEWKMDLVLKSFIGDDGEERDHVTVGLHLQSEGMKGMKKRN